MTKCAACGKDNPDGAEFCTCGEFLDWERPTSATPGPPEQPEQPEQPEEGTPTPMPVRPDAAPASQPVVEPEEPDAPVGPELVCPRCGNRNAADRRLCRVCGQALLLAEAPARVPWWTRLWQRLTRRRGYTAGTRRGVRTPARWGRVMAVPVALIVLLGGMQLVRSGAAARMVEAVRDRVTKPTPLTPAEASASSWHGDAVASKAFDGTNDMFWAPDGPAEGAWIEVTFQRPVQLRSIVVTAGVSANKQQFLAGGRPRELRVTATSDSGRVTTHALNLADKPKGQQFTFRADTVVRVRVEITSTYPLPQGSQCAIAELEFFGRS
ncbi:MAG: discoidin domain-containing protein [Micromonosporaceae bacterium]|nr:discoidin domain-containing protein [Micromonosporaceae bacterium]